MKKTLMPMLAAAIFVLLVLADFVLLSTRSQEVAELMYGQMLRYIVVRPLWFAFLPIAALSVLNLFKALPSYGSGWKQWLVRVLLSLPIILSWLKIALHFFAAVDGPPLLPHALDLMNYFADGRMYFFFVLWGLAWFFTRSKK